MYFSFTKLVWQPLTQLYPSCSCFRFHHVGTGAVVCKSIGEALSLLAWSLAQLCKLLAGDLYFLQYNIYIYISGYIYIYVCVYGIYIYIVYIYCVFFHFANDLGGWPRLTNSLNWLWLEWFWRWVETCSRPCWNHQPGCCWWLRGCLWSAFAGPKEG